MFFYLIKEDNSLFKNFGQSIIGGRNYIDFLKTSNYHFLGQSPGQSDSLVPLKSIDLGFNVMHQVRCVRLPKYKTSNKSRGTCNPQSSFKPIKKPNENCIVDI